MTDFDVFITTSGKRPDLFADVHAWWLAAVGIGRLNIVDAGGTLRGFDADRRRIAEGAATSEVYVLTDDDVLPRADPRGFEFAAILAWFRHPDPRFAQLAAWLDNEPIKQIAGVPVENGTVIRTSESGGCRFRRRGVWTDIPDVPAPHAHFDEWDAAIAREKGFEVGYLWDFHALHTGKFRSEQWTVGGEALEHSRSAGTA